MPPQSPKRPRPPTEDPRGEGRPVRILAGRGGGGPGPAAGYLFGRREPETPPRNPLFDLKEEEVQQQLAILLADFNTQIESNPPKFGDTTGPFLPYLLVRSFTGDRGMARPLSFANDFIMEPDIWVWVPPTPRPTWDRARYLWG